MSTPKRNWRDSIAALQKPSVKHNVGGKTFYFYAISPALAAEIAVASAPLAQAVSDLMVETNTDNARHYKDTTDVTEGITVRETEVHALDPDMARLRADNRSGAVSALLKALGDPATRLLGAQLICDSMRDDFDRDFNDHAEFLDSIDLGDLLGFLAGVGKANKGVFDPLGLGAVREMLTAKTSAALKNALSSNDSRSENPSSDPESGGETSKTQPSEQSEPASSSAG